MKHLVSLLFISGALCGCKKKDTTALSAPTPETPNPLACFKTSACFIQPGDTVKFTNCSSDFTSAKWDFNDGGSSADNSPGHVFASKGVYRVSMTASEKTKSSAADTTIYCGMQASATFTFFYSDRVFPSEWPNTLVSELVVTLYRLPDTLNAVGSHNFGYRIINSEGNHVWEVALNDPYATYVLKSYCQIAGHTTGPDPNIDYTIQSVQGTAYSPAFGVLSPGPAAGSTQMKNLVLNYQRSPVTFK